jgi:hypothetical protein
MQQTNERRYKRNDYYLTERHYKRRYYYLTAHSEQEKKQLLSEIIHVNHLFGYPIFDDIRKNRIRIKVLIPQLYPDAPKSYWDIYLIKLRYNK